MLWKWESHLWHLDHAQHDLLGRERLQGRYLVPLGHDLAVEHAHPLGLLVALLVDAVGHLLALTARARIRQVLQRLHIALDGMQHHLLLVPIHLNAHLILGHQLGNNNNNNNNNNISYNRSSKLDLQRRKTDNSLF